MTALPIVMSAAGVVRPDPVALSTLVAGRRDRDASPASSWPPDPAGLVPPVTAAQVGVLLAAVVVVVAVAWWVWWRRDHRGWATGADLDRHLSVAALRRAAPQVRPGMSLPRAATAKARDEGST